MTEDEIINNSIDSRIKEGRMTFISPHSISSTTGIPVNRVDIVMRTNTKLKRRQSKDPYPTYAIVGANDDYKANKQ